MDAFLVSIPTWAKKNQTMLQFKAVFPKRKKKKKWLRHGKDIIRQKKNW